MIENLAGALENCGHRCAMAVLARTPGPHCERFRTVHCLGRTSFFDWRAVGRLYKLCQEERIDIIHTHDAASQAVAAILKLRHPRSAPPILMTYHRSINTGSATWRDRLRNRLSCVWTGPVVAVSEERRQNYIRSQSRKSRRVICIPNGTDVERFHPCATTRANVRQQLGIRIHRRGGRRLLAILGTKKALMWYCKHFEGCLIRLAMCALVARLGKRE